ncbi:MAG: hypothetical protein K1X44_02385 [Alphaproteobacteria bacterium]|nr:hypothetical protein [Alphaproteobacteria bacterium]
MQLPPPPRNCMATNKYAKRTTKNIPYKPLKLIILYIISKVTGRDRQAGSNDIVINN